MSKIYKVGGEKNNFVLGFLQSRMTFAWWIVLDKDEEFAKQNYIAGFHAQK